MKFFRFFVTDFVATTRHLSTREKGVFVMLLCEIYLTEQPLSYDEKDLFLRLNFTGIADKEAARRVLMEFFTRTDEGWICERAQREIKGSIALSERNKRNRMGGR